MDLLEQNVLNAIALGKSYSEIQKEFGVTKSYVHYRKSKHYKDVLERKKEKEINDKEFEELVIKLIPFSYSLGNVCTKLGIRGVEGYYKKIKKIINDNNLDISHFSKKKCKNKIKQYTDEEYFVENANRNGNNTIKRLIEHGYKQYCCENPNCGISKWHNKTLKLQCHHINGNHYDNRLENLMILCPNCHSQTETYCISSKVLNKNTEPKFLTRKEEIKKGKFLVIEENEIERYCCICGKILGKDSKKYCSHKCAQKGSMANLPDVNGLLEDFKKYGSFVQVSKLYGVSDKCISKRFKKYGLPYKTKELKEYIIKMGTDAEKN